MRVRRRIGHSEAAEELDVGGKFKVWIWPEFLCAGACGNLSPSGNCLCDYSCLTDMTGCCKDFATTCGSSSTSGVCLTAAKSECAVCGDSPFSGCSCDPTSLECAIDTTGALGLCCHGTAKCCP